MPASLFRLRAAACAETPVNDSMIGSSARLVNTRMPTPTLAMIASSWITGTSTMVSTAKPTTSASSAVMPAANRRRKV
ncbi:hypothetical protein D3C75_1111770 [compost metagenome]